MKKGFCIDTLYKNLKDDFGNETNEFGNKINRFENFTHQLKKNILASKRSLEDQRVEAMAILEKNKHKQLLSLISICISVISLTCSFMLNAFGDETKWIILFVYCFLLFTLSVVYFAFGQHTKNSNALTYYSLKLYCIDCIEKEYEAKKLNKVKIIKCRKCKNKAILIL